MLSARQAVAGPSCSARATRARDIARSISSAATLQASHSSDSGRPHSLHLGARKQQLRDAVSSGRGGEVKHDDFQRLLGGEKRQSRGLGSRGIREIMPEQRRRIDTLGRKPSLRKLESIFGEETLPRRPTRSLKYPSQIKKFVARQLEGPVPATENRVLPREVTDPFLLSDKLTRFVKQHKNAGLLGIYHTEEAIRLVTDAVPHAQNVVVWNQLLGVVGHEGMLDRQWRLFNDMKRRGTAPSTRTYTTMLSSYVKHGQISELNTRALSRVTRIFDTAMAHVRKLMKKPESQAEGTGLESAGPVDQDENDTARRRRAVPPDEAGVMPVNAYLAFCAEQGSLQEMQRVFLALHRTGPLSPDSATYTTMLKALSDSTPKAARSQKQSDEAPSLTITARGLWEQAVRQFRTPDESLPPTPRAHRQIDFILANQAIVTLSKGRWDDQKYAMDIIPTLFDLSLPGQSASTPRPAPSPALAELPVLPLNTKVATSILTLTTALKRHDLASHFAHLFLDNEAVIASADLPFFQICISAFSESRDVNGILTILNSYQPPGVEDAGWPLVSWHAMLNACRWAKDWSAALHIFRKMTRLREGVEFGREASWKTSKPRARAFAKDARLAIWIDTAPRRPDAEAMALLIKTALQSEADVALQGLRIFMHYPHGQWTHAPSPTKEEQKEIQRSREDAYERAAKAGVTPDPDKIPRTGRLSLVDDPPSKIAELSISQRKAVQWHLILLEDVERCVTKVLENLKVQDKEREMLEGMKADVSRLLLKWEETNTSDGVRYQ